MKTKLRLSFDLLINALMLFIVIVVLLYIAAKLIELGDRPFSTPTEFQHRNAVIQECIQSEQYTVDQCIAIANGKNE